MLSVFIKDYLDSLHELALATDYVTFFGLIKATLSYVLQSLGLAIYYILSFHWLRDFMELPVTFKHTYTLILENGGILKGSPAQLSLSNSAFSFLDTSPASRHSLFSGFFNSFFLSLPLSVAHILTLRALLVNGTIAGLASFFGAFCGQFLFYFCMLFGLEVIMQPLFEFDLVVIIMGCFLTVETLYRLANFPDYTVFSVIDREPLLGFFRLSFMFTWFEQVCVCNFFGNLTVTPAYSPLETTTSSYFLFITLFYFVGLMIGFVVWSLGIYFLVVQVRSLIASKLVNTSFFHINQKIHYSCVLGLLVMTMSSFFYYGYDFFITKACGYIPEDAAMQWIAPSNRQYIHIDSFMEDEEVDDEQEEEDIVVDGKPFQSADQRPELPFEIFAIQAETDEINKEIHYDKLEEKTGLFRNPSTVLRPYYENPKYYNYEEPEFTINDIDVEDKKSGYTGSSFYEDMHLHLISTAFRTDEYEALIDLKSKLYVPETQLYRQFRDKYNTNILYRKLMQLNNFSFLSGQPKTSNLSTADEFTLYNRRALIENYLNSIHRYKRIIMEDLDHIPWAEKVYNQQFKGSLNFIRRFNAVQLSEIGNALEDYDVLSKLFQQEPVKHFGTEEKNKVLKYDQPLYKKNKNDQSALLHEELRFKRRSLKHKRFLKPNETRPLYIGWDNSLRKFMIKSAVIGPKFKSDLLETKAPATKEGETEGKTKKLGSKSSKKTIKKGVTKRRRKILKPKSNKSLIGKYKNNKNKVLKIQGQNKGNLKIQGQNKGKDKKSSIWQRLRNKKTRSGFPLVYTLDKNPCHKYEPVKKRPVKSKRSLPDYLHFQAWSPGVENVGTGTNFKLPTLMVTEQDQIKLEETLEIFETIFPEEEEDGNDNEFKPVTRKELQKLQARSQAKEELQDIFRRMPIYDWYWAMLDVSEDEDKENDNLVSFRFADATHPRIEGIAWPGQNPRYGLTCPTFVDPKDND